VVKEETVMESMFGIRRRTRRFLRAGLETLRDLVDTRMRHLEQKRQRLASHPREAAPGQAPAAPRRRGRPRKVAVQ
jgi:hypothetical protein